MGIAVMYVLEDDIMKTKDTRKVVIYSRKSRFTGKGESIENQVNLCREHIKVNWLRTKNEVITDEDIDVFEDEGYSGKNTKRPHYQQMLQNIRNNKYKAIVCYKLDRISRNVADFSQLIEELEQYNVAFVSYRDNFDTASPTGRAMMMMISVFAQLERDTIAERIVDNLLELAKSGRWLGGVTPTGYKSEQIVGSVSFDGKERKAYKLVIIPDEAKLVKLIFNKYMEMDSLTKLETYLMQNHIYSKNGKKFTRCTLLAILRNMVYMKADKSAWEYFKNKGLQVFSDEKLFDGKHGIMAYNKTDQTKGKTHFAKDIEEWIIAVGKHTGIIDGADWIRVQEMLDENKSSSYRKPRSNVALLTGLIYCADCKSPMRPKLSNRTNAEGELIYDYLCRSKELSKGKNCNMSRINGNIVDKKACEVIFELAEPMSDFQKELKKLRTTINNSHESIDSEIQKLKKIIENHQKEINGLLNQLSLAGETAASEYILKSVNEKDGEIKNLQIRIKELQKQTSTPILSDNEYAIYTEMLTSFKKSFDYLTVEQKRYYIKTFIKRIEWNGSDLDFYLMNSEGEKDDFSKISSEIKENDDIEDSLVGGEGGAAKYGLQMKY